MKLILITLVSVKKVVGRIIRESEGDMNPALRHEQNLVEADQEEPVVVK